MQPVLHADCVVYLPISFYDCTEKVISIYVTFRLHVLLKFYEELRSTILKGHDELLDGFSAFLLPAQALACGVKCYKTCSQFHQARKFLRKLEVYYNTMCNNTYSIV